MNKADDSHITEAVDHLFRREAGKMTAILTRIFGFKHADLIEDIVQETFITALKSWSFKVKPDNPSAWLMQVAKNKTLNAIKRDRRFIRNSAIQQQLSKNGSEPEAVMNSHFLDHEIKDSQLRILFACCQPALSPRKQIALTLKTISGFNNAEIARALLMSEPAVKKMIYRARKSIRDEELTIEVPFINEAEKRLESARTVCYLMFNEGYKRTEGGQCIKQDLCAEAVRLVSVLSSLQRGAAESAALLALMLFSTARFPARLDGEGHSVDLENQDRALWDQELIQTAFYYLKKARKAKSVSRYHLEAGIASVHCAAKTYGQTDWETIVSYYRKLDAMLYSPVAKLNYVIALSKRDGPEAGLRALNESGLQTPLERYSLLYTAKADMYFRMQAWEQAGMYYRLALELANAKHDRRFLLNKITHCDLSSISNN